MRFLHTGDWHLGKPIRGISRQSEAEEAVVAVVDIAQREQVDAVIIAGDIFDASSPPADAERLLYDALVRLLREGTKVIMVAGNHDHGSRMEAQAGVLRMAGVYSTGAIPTRAEDAMFSIPSRDGTETAMVATLPWFPEHTAVDYENLLAGAGEPLKQYAGRLEWAMGRVCAGFTSRTVNLYVGHLLVDGAVVAEGGGERKVHIGQNFAVPAAALPATAQYVALGHVHRPQRMAAGAPVFYAGSLLQLDFGEAGQAKSVRIVEAHPGLPARFEEIPVTAGRRLEVVHLAYADLLSHAGRYGDAYLKVLVDLDHPEPSLYDIVRDVLPNAVDVRPVLSGRLQDGPVPPGLEEGLSPPELFTRYYQREYGGEPAEELLALFNQLLEAESGHATA